MSHTDYIAEPPKGYEIIAHTDDCPCAAMQNTQKNIYAVQFHPEVTHSVYGKEILHNFLYEICRCSGDWVMDNFIENTVKSLREKSETKMLSSVFLAELTVPLPQVFCPVQSASNLPVCS